MANKKHLAVLKAGEVSWINWKSQNPEIKPDFSGANLSQFHLIKVDLSAANFSVSNLSGANLSQTNLSGAYFIGADMSLSLIHI